MTRLRVTLGMIVFVGLVAAACSGDDSGDGGDQGSADQGNGGNGTEQTQPSAAEPAAPDANPGVIALGSTSGLELPGDNGLGVSATAVPSQHSGVVVVVVRNLTAETVQMDNVDFTVSEPGGSPVSASISGFLFNPPHIGPGEIGWAATSVSGITDWESAEAEATFVVVRNASERAANIAPGAITAEPDGLMLAFTGDFVNDSGMDLSPGSTFALLCFSADGSPSWGGSTQIEGVDAVAAGDSGSFRLTAPGDVECDRYLATVGGRADGSGSESIQRREYDLTSGG